jgi:hypothetical protein
MRLDEPKVAKISMANSEGLPSFRVLALLHEGVETLV